MNHNQYHSDLTKLLNKLLYIPPHNPERFETTDGYDNPDCTNGKRATFATTVLDVFQKTCGMTEETDTAAADLICDLLHLVHASGSQPLVTLVSALGHFIAEAGRIEMVSPDSQSLENRVSEMGQSRMARA